MDTDEESLHASSNGAETQQSMNFGFGEPVAIPRESSPVEIPAASQLKFNFGFSSANINMLPGALDTPLAIPQSKFNFGFLPTNTDTLPAVPVAPTATPFNFGFTPTNTHTPPAIQDEPTATPPCKFNFGFTPTKAATPPAVTVALLKFNFVFASDHKPEQLQSSLSLGPFNFGMEMNSRSPRSITPMLAPQPMNFISTAFQFDCGVSLARVGNWKPVPIITSAPSTSPDPPTTLLVTYTSQPLPHTAGQLELLKRTSALAGGSQPDPALQTVIGNAERAVMDIIQRLKGDEFDALARQMLGIVVGPSDELWQPTLPEVLQTNHVLLSVLCETRDRLTHIFTDLINLHKIVTVHACIVPAVSSLSREVENAESKSSGSQ
ncbi:hypothetical protein F4604DRAFT_1936123 [Suillus subluteus]|nr:hypothetical protein F4604DRAFT_1936123 [Suillus subluteus]